MKQYRRLKYWNIWVNSLDDSKAARFYHLYCLIAHTSPNNGT